MIGDVYADWDIDQLAAGHANVLTGEGWQNIPGRDIRERLAGAGS
jgi:hypothetical protein